MYYIADETKTTYTENKVYLSRAGKLVNGDVTYKKFEAPVKGKVKRFFAKVDKFQSAFNTPDKNKLELYTNEYLNNQADKFSSKTKI